jgi:uncharacterized protein (DUF3084 family)
VDQDHNELLKSMVSKFDSIMDRKVDIYIRQSIRLNSTVRVGMIILGVVGFSIFLLLFSLSSQVGHMNQGVKQMTRHFAQVDENMLQVNRVLRHIETRMALMSPLEQEMRQAQEVTQSLHQNIETIQQSMGEVSKHMNQLQQRMQVVNQRLAGMQAAVGGVGYETHQISKPLRKLP